jgi:hypothetical protein
MVKVQYMGRLGNNMFQYALGRYVAQKMSYQLIAGPLPFRATSEEIAGSRYTTPEQTLTGQFCDIKLLIEDQSPRVIILKGYFQQANIYLSFFSEIKKWFEMPNPENRFEITDSDMLIYIRLGDYFQSGNSLRSSYYHKVIEMANPRRVFISTDEPQHSFLDELRTYNPFIISISNDPASDLRIAKLFSKIAISCSTFSWWAAFLSDASEIYFPIPKKGRWSGCNNKFIDMNDVDLRIDDSRFIYLYNCTIISDVNELFSTIECNNPNLMPIHKRSKAFQFF